MNNILYNEYDMNMLLNILLSTSFKLIVISFLILILLNKFQFLYNKILKYFIKLKINNNNKIKLNNNNKIKKNNQLNKNNMKIDDIDNNINEQEYQLKLKKYQKKLNNLNIPKHISIIMDGNRRYGKLKYSDPLKGHEDGVETLKNIVKFCSDINIKILTVYAFSTENWNRSQTEIDILMNLFCQYADQITDEALKNDVKIKGIITDENKLPKEVLNKVKYMENKTKNGKSFLLNLCLSYGSRGEIINICQNIANDVKNNKININDINEDYFKSKIYTGIEDPDILIRTSGERRLSNFLLYQLAYTELFFIDKFWPEFNEDDIFNIIEEFNNRKRRFGK